MKFLTLIFIKLIIFIMKFFGKKAGTLPGKLALKIDKKIYNYFKIKGKIIVITGTNGKTTTTDMLYQILKKDNKVVCNIGGNNIGWGIVSTLINNSNIFGKINCDYLILETDEHWIPQIYKYENLKINTMIILNFFRDQLDRSGEIETLILKLDRFISNNPCTLILNGNDPNVIRLGINNKGKNYYYAVDELKNSKKISHDKMEGIICPNCLKELTYDYYHYAHIGKFVCKDCGFGNINYDLVINKIVDNSFYINNEKYECSNINLYNVYNLASIILFCKLNDININIIKNTINNYHSNNGRGQEFKINNNSVKLYLGKNPTGFNVVFSECKKEKGKKELLIIINDKINDGHDISWIWDIDFSNINSFEGIICSGTRANDLAIRIKCSGYDEKKIQVNKDISDSINMFVSRPNKKFIISNYSALIGIKEYLEKIEDDR